MKRRRTKEVAAAVLTLRDLIKTREQASAIAVWLHGLARLVESDFAKIAPNFRARYFRKPRPAREGLPRR